MPNNDELLKQMTELLRKYTVPVIRTFADAEKSKYSWTDLDAEKEYERLYGQLQKSFRQEDANE
jgi:hypothetical protein